VLPALSLCLAWGPIGAARAADRPLQALSEARPPVEGGAARKGPDMSYIDSQTPTCYKPRETSQVCFVEWSYFAVTATASQYLLNMKVELDGRVRAYYDGFFQTSMYVPAQMFKPGFAVVCGQPGEGGDPRLGRQYGWVVRAEESSGQTATSSGAIFCPATNYIFVDGFVSGNTSAWSASLP
jgi:hypothetical protein